MDLTPRLPHRRVRLARHQPARGGPGGRVHLLGEPAQRRTPPRRGAANQPCPTIPPPPSGVNPFHPIQSLDRRSAVGNQARTGAYQRHRRSAASRPAAREAELRPLPSHRLAWLLAVWFLPLIGPIAWFRRNPGEAEPDTARSAFQGPPRR
ncbi:PLD nuclease N-terminal domain-containing protein [Nocardia farcinica]|uniref:PLD nuclease N-terminal domain-containing protein n=1 Tax=Nocardia farcinica TaxID=37329 RepID=UPI000E1C1A7A